MVLRNALLACSVHMIDGSMVLVKNRPCGHVVCDGAIVRWKLAGKAKVTQFQLAHTGVACKRTSVAPHTHTSE